ncbi:DUF4194 domain-containing protein [Frigoribacterium endophyticum]|uniref:DUF4194 domain-containing protein n=1 Tax=Frigoribacterium endophyticum TaxID=1522176 RepID=UPI001FB98876|nr:DUF4194 domain-containing protein [Frigoribacterium endophyticum]NII51011.1 hypothetical protein [Frigoribacterium endophyticum]
MSHEMPIEPQSEVDGEVQTEAEGLWEDDLGTLPDSSRRALLHLIRGPYLSFRLHAQLWSALLRDETAIRTRLNELFLELIVDLAGEVAFVRNVQIDGEDSFPKTVRSAPLTFLDTGMLLVLRQLLLDGDGSERVIIGREDVDEQLEPYRDAAASDPAAFTRRLNASWTNMKKFGVIVDAESEERVEISPVLRLVFGPEEIAAVRDEYRRIAEKGRS